MSGANLLIFEMLLIYFAVFYTHAVRKRYSFAPMYALLGGLTVGMWWFSDAAFKLKIGTFLFDISSVTFFTGLLIGVLLLYIFDGSGHARTAINVIILISAVVPLLEWVSFRQLAFSGYSSRVMIAFPGLRVYLASIATLIMDFVLLVLIWEILKRGAMNIGTYPKLFVTLLSVLWLDALMFYVGAIRGEPHIVPTIRADLTSRLVIAALASLLVAVYLKMYEAEKGEMQRPILSIFDPAQQIERELAKVREEVEKRERLAKELRDSEEKYRSMVESLPDMLYTMDRAGNFLFVSKAAERILGVRQEGAIGMSLSDLTPPEDYEASLKVLNDVFDRGATVEGLEWRIRDVRGRLHYFSTNGGPLRDASGNIIAFQGIARDLTSIVESERQRAEAEERFRSIFEEAKDAILLGKRDGEIIDANNASCQMLGYSKEALIKGGAARILSEKTWAEIINMAADQRSGGGTLLETEVVRSDGVGVDLEVSAKFMKIGDEEHVLVIARDVTERKKAERDLLKRHRFLTAIADIAQFLLRVHNPDEDLDFGAIVEMVGRAAAVSRTCVFLNYRDEDGRLYAKQVAEWCAEGVKPQMDNPLLQRAYYDELAPRWLEILSRGGVINGVVTDFPEKEREILETQDIKAILIFPFIVNGEFEGFIGFVNCVEAKVLEPAEENLLRAVASSVSQAMEMRKAQEQLQFQAMLLDQISDNIAAMDMKGRIIYVNRAEASFAGKSKEELIGRTAEVCMGVPGNGDAAKKLMQVTLEQGKWEGEMTERRSDGAEAVMYCRTWVVRDRDGKPIALCRTATDITEMKRLERQLQQAQKMEALGTLAGGIAHDFNNFLAGVMGYISLLKAEITPGHKYYRIIEQISRYAERAKDLTLNILSFARPTKREQKPMNINDCVRDVISLLERTVDRKIRLNVRLQEDLPGIIGDPTQIQQVIMNLCVNAVHAMPDGGTLTVSTSVVDLTERRLIPYPKMKPGRYVCLKVEDTGIGMSKEVMEHIFEPFFTTKGAGVGTGLGLSTVYGIVKNHDGFIEVSSQVGKGSIFEVFIPVSEMEVTEVRPQEEVIKKGSGTILVIEDEEIVRNMLVELLKHLGYQAIAAEDGERGVEEFKRNSDKVDLVIVDLNMPRMDGRETFREIKKIKDDVKVMISTGVVADDDINDLMAEGVVDFIQKPYSLALLSEKLNKVLGGGS